MHMIGWIAFGIIVVISLVLDLGVFNRKIHEVTLKESLLWSAVWISLAIAFGLGVLYFEGGDSASQYFTAYVLEKSLSVDNLFVFLVIFNYFRIRPEYQHRILFWGILGALVMRIIFIAAGVTLMEIFHPIIYVFGGFLLLTGIKLGLQKDKEIDPEKNPVLRMMRKYLPISTTATGDHFFTQDNGKRLATTSFVVLVLIESSDVVFAVDSIPAVLAISNDIFLIYTSNIFAILGLRSLYFALAGIMKLFHYLKYGLVAVLVLVGVKMLVSDFFKINSFISLAFITGILAFSVFASIMWPPKKDEKKDETPHAPMAP
jgi:tellurite resistance protein TerC